MITWTVGLTVHPGQRDAWVELANELTTSSHALDDGCVVYLCLADPDDPLEFLWYEQWDSMDAIRVHSERLHGLLGGAAVAPDPLPPRLMELLARREVTAWHELQLAPPAPADRVSPKVTVVTYADATGDAAPLLWRLTAAAHDARGCVTYVWHTHADEPSRLLLFEQWATEADYVAWIERADPPAAISEAARLSDERRFPVVA